MTRGLFTLFIGLLLVLAPLIQLDPPMEPSGPPESVVPDEGSIPSFEAHDIDDWLSGLPGHFVENRGQISNPDVRFYAHGNPLSVGLTVNSVLFTLYEAAEPISAGSVPSKGTPRMIT
jgi:hypothetical protein